MDLKPLFEPKTMAVIGVSLHNDLNPANVIYYKNFLRYPVDTYAVNPKAGLLKGQRAFSSISELPVKIDLAVIAAQAAGQPASPEALPSQGGPICRSGSSPSRARPISPSSGRTVWACMPTAAWIPSSSPPNGWARPERAMWP